MDFRENLKEHHILKGGGGKNNIKDIFSKL